MIGKTVKIDLDILQILYPDYKPLSYVTFLNQEDNVIYTGNPFNNLKGYLEKNTKSFINTVGNPELDYSNKDVLLEYVYNRKGKKLSKKVLDFLSLVDDKEFYYCLKLFIVTDKMPYSFEKAANIYSLYKALNDSSTQVIRTYHDLLEVYPFPIIEASFLSFLNRVANNQIDNVSKKYGLLVNNTYLKVGKKLKNAIIKYSKSTQNELDFLALLLELMS